MTNVEESFLPLEKMKQLVDKGVHDQYMTAEPYPSIVFDDFFDEAVIAKALAVFPDEKSIEWKRFNSSKELKLASSVEENIPLYIRQLIYHMNSSLFLNFLSELTGIKNLIPDPYLEGGGLHQIMPGGKLGIHSDFNKHTKLKLDRRINVLLYLNRDWKEEYGGDFELWDTNMTHCVQKVAPLFNRMAIFSTA